VSNTTSAKPDTHAWVLPFITVSDPAKTMLFLEQAFGFKKEYANEQAGKIVHAEMSYMGQIVLLITMEGMHSKDVKTPAHSKAASPTVIFIYIKNIDEKYAKALSLGAQSIEAPATYPWGERHCHFLDADGHHWQLAEVADAQA